MQIIGLSEKQVVESRNKHGSNQISIKKRHTFLQLFIESLGEPMTKILLIALAVKTLFLLSSFDWYETVGIAIAIFIASFISTISEYGSEESFQKLQSIASKINCRVYRDNLIKEIFIDEVVQNDHVLLQSGDKIPADGIVIKGSIEVDESLINGEVTEITKDITNNKLYRGSIVCSGECEMLVTAVGDKTIYGSIGLELQEEKRDGPLKYRLRMLAKLISKMGYIGAFLVSFSYLFDVLIINNNFNLILIKQTVNNIPLLIGYVLHAITLAVTVIVVAVPEGLPMMITLVLSRNMKKMLKDNILVRRLLGIETFGSLNLLFVDKTGTLTKGKLEVINFIDAAGVEHKQYKNNKLFDLMNISLKYNNSSVHDKRKAIGGNATDRALLNYIVKYEKNFNVMVNKQILFDSITKISTTKISGDYNLTLIKGMPEKIITASNYCYDNYGNKKEFKNKKRLIKKLDELSKRGYRFIALATSSIDVTNGLKNLSLIGLIGLRDELRENMIQSVEQVQKAGIKVVMMTGDSKNTALAIAKDLNLIKTNSLVLTSDELSKMSDQEISEKLLNISIIARALPSDKSRLVKIAQELNLVVGMTGDGVNDAPAIKKADVGIAMGSGTEVAKEASDVVILDNNFESIVKAILYGRTIFKNIRKFIILQLTINMCAVGISIVGPFIGIDNPITVIQMLWVNMVMDTLAALAFAGEPALKEYMGELPKKRNEAIVNNYMKGQIIFTGLYSFLLCLIFLKTPFLKNIYMFNNSEIYLMSAFFALFIFIGIFNCFNARTHRLNLLGNIFKNKGFIVIILLISIIQIYIIYFGGTIFRVTSLNFYQFLIIILLSGSVIPIDWLRKLWLRKRDKNTGV